MDNITRMISNLKFFKTVIEHLSNSNNPHNVTKEQLGLTMVLEWKGSVPTFDDLPSNPQEGWVYSVEQGSTEYPPGMNFAWNGTKWDDLGGTLAGFLPVDSIITNEEIDAITEA